MVDAWITEYSQLEFDGGETAEVPPEPALVDQKISFTTATQCAAFDVSTRYVRIVVSAAAHVQFGVSPTATADMQPLEPGVEYWRRTEGGHKISFYDGAT